MQYVMLERAVTRNQDIQVRGTRKVIHGDTTLFGQAHGRGGFNVRHHTDVRHHHAGGRAQVRAHVIGVCQREQIDRHPQ